MSGVLVMRFKGELEKVECVCEVEEKFVGLVEVYVLEVG